MPTGYTGSPSSILPEQVLGAPIKLPCVLLCQAGENWCGWKRTANTRTQFAEYATERRRHEENCAGGLIVVGGR